MFYPTYSPRRFRNKLLNAKSAGDAEVGMSANMIEMAVGAPPFSMGTAEEADAKMSDIIAEDAAEAAAECRQGGNSPRFSHLLGLVRPIGYAHPRCSARDAASGAALLAAVYALAVGKL